MLEQPFNTFHVEKYAGEYKDFGSNSDYPLRGVTYPVDYGYIEGFVGEDGANLDVFVGTEGTLYGYIKVMRPELKDGEHKFYLNVTDEEEHAILRQFAPVLLEHGRFQSFEQLQIAVEPYKN